MESSNKHTLWVSKKERIYFLIPDAVVLPDGNYTIRQIRGIERQVKLEAIAPYKISAQEAEPYMQEEVAQILALLSGLCSSVVNVTLDNSKEISTVSEKTSAQSVSTLLTNLLGVPLEEFMDNPAAAREGLQSFMAEVAAAAQPSNAQNLDQAQAVKANVEATLKALQSSGLEMLEVDTHQLIQDLAKVVTEFSEELKSNFAKSSTHVKTAAAQMQAAAFKIDSSFSNLSQTLSQGLTKLQNVR
ncbi:MAG: hypothetical protein HC886_14595 [Leptolyngbyaceae cyanobacterium SM1_1_3]|nr:hypothetical protein [Leptolyngbyaceae cyanobacterium SM1_1_3]NJM84956.1 hypothetical protein [Leptolyngbyaceae cyanobacterium RM2_2_21]NJN03243.1 hypothetical protein [Leptolyngbyaceae cyanobacterium RM1_1_2]NJO10930.1 hypothetical protein [Leptolyngbyaceae cyanobacterium SL_1_1]